MIYRIYKSLPFFLKVIVLNIKGYFNNKERYSKGFNSFFEKYSSIWYSDLKEIKEYQESQLRELLIDVYKSSDWYGKIMRDLGIKNNEIKRNPIGVLKKMPVLTKEQRRSEVDKIVNKSRKTVATGFTSGTSGSPTKTYECQESINKSFAVLKRFHKVIGINKNVKQIRFSGRIIISPTRTKPPFWIYNIIEKQLFMSTYHLTEENLKSYIKKINKFKPELIDGYPSAIYVIAKYINKTKQQLDFSPKAIAVTAETLYDYQRIEIEKAFSCKVYNQYASSEGSPYISECKEGNLHLNLDTGFFIFKKTKGNIAQLIVTGFRNLKTPIINYDIGDTVLISKDEKTCNCGCKMPIIEKITGREDDILWTEEKGFVGRMDTAYKGLSGIIKSQIIQQSPSHIIVNNIVDKYYDELMDKKLKDNLKERLGRNIKYEIKIVDNIPLGASGKFDAVKRNFKMEDYE